MSLFNELKRRNVFRVVIGYVVLAWLVMQVADVVLNNITAPDWVFQAMMLFLGLGLLFAVFFSWAFEMTPEGIKRESEIDRSQSITQTTGKKLDRMITGILVVALGYFIFDKFVLSSGREQAAIDAALEQAGTAPVTQDAQPLAIDETDHSIAVLPFVNMSSDPEQEYFSDGLSEELLNLLAKIPELKVASRSSAFQFKGEKIDLTEVAQKLKVAHVLEGSVRKAGNQLRITAQLIKADNGYHMWSETYDRSLDNIFAIQDEISAAVVAALKIELLGEAPKAQVVDPEAYALWLKGKFLFTKWGKENFEAADDALNQALAIDPGFVDAWASLSVVYLTQAQNGYRDRDEAMVLAKNAMDKALAINPELPQVLARLATLQRSLNWDWKGSEETVLKAMLLAPKDIYVLNSAGNLYSSVGRFEEALAAHGAILDQDPLNLVALYNKGDILVRMGRLDEAEATFLRLLELNPEDWGTHTQLGIILLLKGMTQEAWDEFALEVDPIQQEFGRLLALHSLGRKDEASSRLDAFIEANQSRMAYMIGNIYAWYGQHDEAFSWLERAFEQREAGMGNLIGESTLASVKDDPRYADLVQRVGLKSN